ncbi:MAG: hypothetical protein LBO69_06710, partial [Ignavibacteria bacterium]|nr:hypothetical protein [Ignavibacteria bacterium]
MNKRKETRAVQAAEQTLSNQTLYARMTLSNYSRLLMTAFMKKSEATANDAIFAFNQNAKLYLSKIFYPIAFASILIVIFLLSSGEAFSVSATWAKCSNPGTN